MAEVLPGPLGHIGRLSWFAGCSGCDAGPTPSAALAEPSGHALVGVTLTTMRFRRFALGVCCGPSPAASASAGAAASASGCVLSVPAADATAPPSRVFSDAADGWPSDLRTSEPEAAPHGGCCADACTAGSKPPATLR